MVKDYFHKVANETHRFFLLRKDSYFGSVKNMLVTECPEYPTIQDTNSKRHFGVIVVNFLGTDCEAGFKMFAYIILSILFYNMRSTRMYWKAPIHQTVQSTAAL